MPKKFEADLIVDAGKEDLSRVRVEFTCVDGEIEVDSIIDRDSGESYEENDCDIDYSVLATVAYDSRNQH